MRRVVWSTASCAPFVLPTGGSAAATVRWMGSTNQAPPKTGSEKIRSKTEQITHKAFVGGLSGTRLDDDSNDSVLHKMGTKTNMVSDTSRRSNDKYRTIGSTPGLAEHEHGGNLTAAQKERLGEAKFASDFFAETKNHDKIDRENAGNFDPVDAKNADNVEQTRRLAQVDLTIKEQNHNKFVLDCARLGCLCMVTLSVLPHFPRLAAVMPLAHFCMTMGWGGGIKWPFMGDWEGNLRRRNSVSRYLWYGYLTPMLLWWGYVWFFVVDADPIGDAEAHFLDHIFGAPAPLVNKEAERKFK